MKAENSKNIFIIDENKLFGRMLGNILSSGCDQVVPHFMSEHEFFSLPDTISPDLIVFDLYYASDKFNTALNDFLTKFPKTKIVVLSFDVTEQLIEVYIERGVHGFFDKSIVDPRQLVTSFNKVLAGEVVVLTSQLA